MEKTTPKKWNGSIKHTGTMVMMILVIVFAFTGKVNK
jgi:hypothetical protein